MAQLYSPIVAVCCSPGVIAAVMDTKGVSLRVPLDALQRYALHPLHPFQRYVSSLLLFQGYVSSLLLCIQKVCPYVCR